MGFVTREFWIEDRKILEFLINELKFSPREAKRAIDRGRVSLNGKRVTEKGMRGSGLLRCILFEPEGFGLTPFFETPHFALFDKPSGVPIHPKKLANTKTLLDDVRRLFGPEANLVHRLDRETSGVVIASKNRFAEREFKTAFQRREVDKEYLAVVRGKIERPLRISAPLEANRDPAIKVKMVVSPTGREAITDLVPLEKWGEFTLVKLRPLTGRQHQLRVHLAHIGHPIVGDPLYGVPVEVGEAYLDKKLSPTERLRWCLAPRLLLHAYKIGFRFFGNRYKLISPTDFKREAKRILGIEK